MKSREYILGRLRQGKQAVPRKRPFSHTKRLINYRPMVPQTEREQLDLTTRFVHEAEKAGCVLHQVSGNQEAINVVLALIGEDTAVSCWQVDQLPIPGLEAALDKANIERFGQDSSVRVGLTGVDAALAATGSVVVMSGNGRYRAASLLPPVHIAVVSTNQIIPDLESWWTQQRAKGLEQMRKSSNIVFITGPSRTADIAMQLVMGMHGPRKLHIVLFQEEE